MNGKITIRTDASTEAIIRDLQRRTGSSATDIITILLWYAHKKVFPNNSASYITEDLAFGLCLRPLPEDLYDRFQIDAASNSEHDRVMAFFDKLKTERVSSESGVPNAEG